MFKRNSFIILVICAMLASITNVSIAEENDSNFDLTLGITGGVKPEYSGSNDSEAVIFPLVVGKYKINKQHSMRFNPYEGLAYAYKQSDAVSYGIKADFRNGRDSSDDITLSGMNNIDATIEVGPWMKIKQGQLTYMANIGVDAMGGYNGFTAELGVKYNIPINKQWKADIGASVLYGDANYAMTYYGVDSSHVTSSRSFYEAGSGFQEATLSASLTYFISDKTFVRGDIGYKHLIGDAKNSPLTEKDNQFLGFMSVGYKF